MTTARFPRNENRLRLVPRMIGQGYSASEVQRRRDWLAKTTDCDLDHVAGRLPPTEELRGNVENPIGIAQTPLGIAGPLLVRGQHAQGAFYIPLATTEGALVRSYERGMVVITRAGGVTTRISLDENRVAPVFFFQDVASADYFVRSVVEKTPQIRAAAEATTHHGRLLAIDPLPLGRQVVLNFRYHTADAQGMNMIVKATEAACRWIQAQNLGTRYLIFSGYASEKRASGSLLQGGKGKRVTAGVRLARSITTRFLRTTPEEMRDLWQYTVLGHLQAATLGYNGHFANGLTALYIACGQDVANVANSATGITNFEVDSDGSLYASVTLPSLSVATVGGGTAIGTSRECLQMLGCLGAGQARKFAELTAATLLAGEISMGAAIASGEFVAAHETYGRNRPSSP